MNSAGQLIPAIIGIGTVVRVVYKFVLDARKSGGGLKKRFRNQRVHSNPNMGDIPECGPSEQVRMRVKRREEADVLL